MLHLFVDESPPNRPGARRGGAARGSRSYPTQSRMLFRVGVTILAAVGVGVTVDFLIGALTR